MDLLVLLGVAVGIVVTLWWIAVRMFREDDNDMSRLVGKTHALEQQVEQEFDLEEEESEPTVKVIVTYNDGTTETFKNEDGEIEYNDGGALIIRPDSTHCVTISPYAYRKVEEIEQ